MNGKAQGQELAAVYAELLARAPENKMEPRTEPMRRALELLGEPQQAAPVIHLTGTNGKTSTARMIEALLQTYGLRTGRYSSPHLSSVTERISLDGEPVSAEIFTRVWQEIAPVLTMVDAELETAGEPRLTYFEALTLLAFAIFAEEPVQVLVLEVGLGGITDATNLADGQVAVVTPISLDHTELLGETPSEIAEEKAGIFKTDGYAVLAAQPEDAGEVLRARAQELGIPCRQEGIDFGIRERRLAVGGQQLDIQGLSDTYSEVFLPLHGEHQTENAAVATVAVEAFFGQRALEQELVREAFAAVTSPGRLEVLRTAPLVVADAAHNPAGIQSGVTALREAFSFGKLVVVLGVLQEKDARGILEQLYRSLGEYAEELCLTRSNSPRALEPGVLAELALDAGFVEEDLHLTEKVDDALLWAVDRAEDTGGLPGAVLLTGSITLVAEARELLGKSTA